MTGYRREYEGKETRVGVPDQVSGVIKFANIQTGV